MATNAQKRAFLESNLQGLLESVATFYGPTKTFVAGYLQVQADGNDPDNPDTPIPTDENSSITLSINGNDVVLTGRDLFEMFQLFEFLQEPIRAAHADFMAGLLAQIKA